MAHSYDFDLFVIGAGSGGVRASRIAAGLGAKVAVAEDRYLGGTCVNVGCVPKKLFVYASEYATVGRGGSGFGVHYEEPKIEWQELLMNKNQEIKRLNGVYDSLLANSGVTLIDGRARFIDEHTVEVNNQQYTAERILVATGGWPFVPEFPGNEWVMTSNEVFYLDELPKKVLVVGGGYIAVEFAGIFNGLGVETTLVYRGEEPLRGFDDDVRRFAIEEMKKKGIQFKLENNIKEIKKQSQGLQVFFEDGTESLVDEVLYATGRVPHTQDLGLENVDVELNSRGAIVVDDGFKTSVPNIYAIGDVIGRIQLTPVALAEGMALARHFYNNQPIEVDYDCIPTAVFCQPNIGTVGLTEQEARKKYTDIEVYLSEFKPMKHTLSGDDGRVLMKLIVDNTSDKVLGVHMVGDEAGEIIQGMGVALKAGATKEVFDNTIGIHPTSAEEFVTMRTPKRS